MMYEVVTDMYVIFKWYIDLYIGYELGDVTFNQ